MRCGLLLLLYISACFAIKYTTNIKGSFLCNGVPYSIGEYYMLEQSGKGARVIANSTSSGNGTVDFTGTANTDRKPQVSIAFYHACGAPAANTTAQACKSYRQIFVNRRRVYKGAISKHPYNLGSVKLNDGRYNNFMCRDKKFFKDQFA